MYVKAGDEIADTMIGKEVLSVHDPERENMGSCVYWSQTTFAFSIGNYYNVSFISY